jgi:hypothetical protein
LRKCPKKRAFIFGKMGYNLNRGQNMETEIEKKIREVWF